MFNIDAFEHQIAERMAATPTVGFAIAIVQGDEVRYARGFGMTSVEEGGVPVTPQTLFCIGSVTKTLTAAAIMRLIDRGVLDLDTAVSRYVPWLTFSRPEYADGVTLRRLLSHTSGLIGTGGEFGPRDPSGLEAFMRERIPTAAFFAPPGTVHYYSNYGLSLAGYVAEMATETPYPDLMRDLVFAPLAMRRSTFDRTVAMTYPCALPHMEDDAGVLRVIHRVPDFAGGNPSGFALSTVLDLANVAIMHLNEGRFGGYAYLPPALVAAMRRPEARLYTAAEGGYGLAFASALYKGIRRVGHDGTLSSYACRLLMAPAERVAVVAVSNYDFIGSGIIPLVDQVFDALLDLPTEPLQPQTIAPEEERWPRYIGTYLSLAAGLATISVDDDTLTIERYGPRLRLDALASDLYHNPEESVAVGFVEDAQGEDRRTRYIVVDEQPYERIDVDTSFVPDPSRWETYAGRYEEFPDDPYPIDIGVREGQLIMDWFGEHTCKALSDTLFVSDRGTIEFLVAVDGGVPALNLNRSAIQWRVGWRRLT